MIVTGSEDLRVQRTIGAIKKTFEDLICEMDYNRITVTELCKRAKINKKTFYYYYPTLDRLLQELQLEYSKKYIERVKNYTLPDEIDKVNREFFLFSEEQGLAYERIAVSGDYSEIREQMIQKVMDNTWRKSEKFNNLTPLMQDVIVSFLTVVCASTYQQWVLDGKKVPIEDMIRASNALIASGVNGFFDRMQGIPL